QRPGRARAKRTLCQFRAFFQVQSRSGFRGCGPGSAIRRLGRSTGGIRYANRQKQFGRGIAGRFVRSRKPQPRSADQRAADPRSADPAQLGTDLQAGNLTAAQQDFNTLTALGQSGPNKNGQTFQQAGRAQDFQAIGQALQNGDLAGAQSAFATLEGTFGEQSQQAQSAISAYSSNSGGAEIVINLGVASGTSGTSASSGSSGSSAPEVVVNVGQGSTSTSGASGAAEVVIN